MPVKTPMAPMMAAYNWTGFYIGVNGGGGWNTWTGTAAAAGPGINSFSGSGGLAGGTIGGNYQIGNVVLGLEGTYDWADINNTQVATLGLGTLTLVTKNDYVATVAGRVGYAFDRVLIYGKGGAAFTRDRLNANLTGPFPGAANGSFDRTGWLGRRRRRVGVPGQLVGEGRIRLYGLRFAQRGQFHHHRRPGCRARDGEAEPSDGHGRDQLQVLIQFSNGMPADDRLRDEAMQGSTRGSGLLRFARNDGEYRSPE
jgi:hypothetical protein